MVSNKKNKKTQLFLVVKIISIARLILINLNQNLTYTKRFLIIKVKFKIHTRYNIFLFFDVKILVDGKSGIATVLYLP